MKAKRTNGVPGLMAAAVVHEAYAWLIDNPWAHRAAALVLVWVVVLVLVRLSNRFFDLVDRRLTEFGEPARRLASLDSLFDVFVIVLGVLMSLYALGLGPALWGAVAVTGVVGIIVGLAAQRIGQNVLSGLVILFQKPFAVGDFVQTRDHEGTVSKVTLMSTSLVTLDGPVVYMPNSLMIDQPVSNMTAAAARRVQVRIDVLEGRDLQRVRKILEAAPRTDRHLDASRPVTVFATESLDEGIRWTVRYFVARSAFGDHCNAAAMGYILEALNAAGLETAMPAQRVHVQGGDVSP